MSCNWPTPGFNLGHFNTGTDLTLVTATAYQTIGEYPVAFGDTVIEVDKEFSVLTNWEGNVLLGAE